MAAARLWDSYGLSVETCFWCFGKVESGVVRGEEVEWWNGGIGRRGRWEEMKWGEGERRGGDGARVICDEVKKPLDTYKLSTNSSSGAGSKTFCVGP